jgi:anthranilate phosphoribosyltransferase
MMRALLGGRLTGALRNAALLNAAAALAAESGHLAPALAEARAALDSGTALAKLNALIEYSQAHTPKPVE